MVRRNAGAKHVRHEEQTAVKRWTDGTKVEKASWGPAEDRTSSRAFAASRRRVAATNVK